MKTKTFLILLIAAMVFAVPAARAFDKDPWREADKTLRELYVRMDGVMVKRDRWGANPRMRDEIANLRLGIADLTERVKHHAGDPKVARKKGDALSDLMSQVESEYRARAHREHVEVRVY